MRRISLAAVILQLFLMANILMLSQAGWAHQAMHTDTAIDITQRSIRITYTTPIDNIKKLDTSATELANLILHGMELSTLSGPCTGQVIKQRTLASLQAQQFQLEYDCPKPIEVLNYRYSLLLDNDSNHENLVRIRLAGHLTSTTLNKKRNAFSLPVQKMLGQWQATLAMEPTEEYQTNSDENQATSDNAIEGNSSYLMLGVEHILTGYDHLLFLLVLFALPLPWKSILTIITSFTLAHSITLGLAALSILSVPPVITEWVIAFSIVVTAAENIVHLYLKPREIALKQWLKQRLRYRWMLTFTFGLLHGFGFSYVLQEIGLGDSVATNLLLFNLGVEAGQIIALIIVSPILAWLFRSHLQIKGSFLLSSAAGVAGLFWLSERSGLL